MKAYCQYSGVPFSTVQFANLRQKQTIICIHPIFYADTPTLLDLYAAYEEGRIDSLADQRLLFLALLNKTSQVDWNCTADPAPATVAQNMKSLYHHICWLTDLSTAKNINYRLPRFSINEGTKKLTTFRYWLDAWADAYEAYQRGYRSQVEQDKIESLEAKLRELGPLSADRPRANTAFLKCLADWCAIAAAFPPAVSDLWKNILRCESNVEALDFLAADVDELEEWLVDNLETDAGYSYAAFRQVREVKAANAATGINDFYLMPVAGVAGTEDTTQWQMDLSNRSSTELANIQLMIEAAPLTAPNKADYPDSVSYSKAKARYVMAQLAAGNIGVRVNQPAQIKTSKDI